MMKQLVGVSLVFCGVSAIFIVGMEMIDLPPSYAAVAGRVFHGLEAPFYEEGESAVVSSEVPPIVAPPAYDSLGISVHTLLASGRPPVIKKGELDLSGKQLVSLEGLREIDGIEYVEKIFLRKNNLQSLPVDVFSGLYRLRYLDLSHNKLKELPVGIFSDLTAIITLNLSDNEVELLSAGLFSELGRMTFLDISRNKLRVIEMKAFTGLDSLRSLYLKDNSLVELPMRVFEELKNLEWLKLDNKFTKLSGGVFVGLSRLGTLELGAKTYNRRELNSLWEKLGLVRRK